MKKYVSNLMLLAFALFAFAACDKSQVSDLRLDGDCAVTSLTLDTYEASIDPATRTITVRVPETYTATAMTVTAITLSEGATANLGNGDKLNLTSPQTVRVVHGDAYLDWTIVVRHDEAKIRSFVINDTYTGIINEDTHTISVYVPEDADLTRLTPTITLSTDATVTPGNGVTTDFTHPVSFTVVNNTAKTTYLVTVTKIGKPTAVYVGLAATMDQLNIEEQTACRWMLANIPNSIYASFADIKNGTVDLSACRVVWWHFHKDGGVDGKAAFQRAAPEALEASPRLRDYYNGGGAFLFTRFATNMPAEIGAVSNDGYPNNCWGQAEASAETVGAPWNFFIQGHTTHPLYQQLLMKADEPQAVYTVDKGYRITNSTAQWHIGADWGGYANYDTWRAQTGAIDLAYGGDGAIVAWEFPATATKGGILCIGSGCYDWYSIDEVPAHYHQNVASLTLNAFNYLMDNSPKK